MTALHYTLIAIPTLLALFKCYECWYWKRQAESLRNDLLRYREMYFDERDQKETEQVAAKSGG